MRKNPIICADIDQETHVERGKVSKSPKVSWGVHGLDSDSASNATEEYKQFIKRFLFPAPLEYRQLKIILHQRLY